MASSLDPSRSTVSTSPTMYYETDYTAKAVAGSQDAIISWWKTNKYKEPFNKLVADRVSGEPEACILRVGLGFQNERVTIVDVLQEAGIECKGAPWYLFKSVFKKGINTPDAKSSSSLKDH